MPFAHSTVTLDNAASLTLSKPIAQWSGAVEPAEYGVAGGRAKDRKNEGRWREGGRSPIHPPMPMPPSPPPPLKRTSSTHSQLSVWWQRKPPPDKIRRSRGIKGRDRLREWKREGRRSNAMFVLIPALPMSQRWFVI